MIELTLIFLIVIVFASLFVIKPRSAIFLFIGILPLMHKELFSIYQWDYLPARFASLGLGLGVLVSWIIDLRKFGKTKLFEDIQSIIFRDKFFILLLTLLLIKVVAAFASGANIFTNQFILFFIEVNILYLAFKTIVRKSKSQNINKDLIYMYLITGVLAVFFAFVQMILFYSFGMKVGAIWPVPNNLPRLGSLFWDVNHFGGFLVTIIPILFFMVFGVSKYKNKALVLSALAICSIALFLTQSRSSWLGLAVAMIIGVILLITKKHFKPVLLFILGTGLMAGIFFAYLDIKDLSIRQKVASYMHYRLDSTDTHVMLLEGAVQIYASDPILGAGPGNFDSSFRNTETSSKYFEREPALKNQKVPPHSIWGEVIAESGYLGFAAFLLIVSFVMLATLMSFYKGKTNDEAYYGLGLFISLVGILVTGIFYSYNLEFFWTFIFIALLFSSSVLKTELSFTYLFGWAAKLKVVYLVPLLAISAFFIFINLGGVTLLEWDEAIYAKVARNIYESNDWLNLYWLKIGDNWFEKPPLYMWLSALVFKITGPDEFGARLWSAIFGLGTVGITYLAGRKMFNKLSGYIAALVLISTAHFLYYARTSQLDVPVTFFILSSLTAYYYAIQTDRSRNSKILLGILTGVLIGLGVMTKAIIGLIPLGIIGVYEISTMFINRKRPNISIISIILIFSFIVAAPWHYYSIIVHGEDFLDTYFIKHIFDRGTEGLGHENVIWWYFDVLKVSMRVWVFVLVPAVLWSIYKFKSSSAIRLTLISFLFIFAFFSLPKDKLLWYIVPVYPFAALLIGKFINDLFEIILIKLKVSKSDFYKYRLTLLIALILFVPYYITTIKDKIFYEDENESIVELVKVHNQIYPIDQHPELKLRFATVPYTVILFYSEHEPKFTDKDELLDLVKKATPEKFYTFLITENRFYELRGRIRDEFEEPHDLRIKASSGRYVIARSYSDIEMRQEKVGELTPEINDLLRKRFKGEITSFEVQKLASLKIEYVDLVNRLNEDGYPVADQITFE